MISFGLSGLACAFVALCYAELASLIPVLGQHLYLHIRDARRNFRLDHRLGLGARMWRGPATVAAGWSGYFEQGLQGFGIVFRRNSLRPIF